MIAVSAKVNPDALATVIAKGKDAIRRCVVFYHSALLQALNVSNPRPYTTPSAPGEAPRKRTGGYQRNCVYAIAADGLSGVVGFTKNVQGQFLGLEVGRLNRPAMRLTLAKVLPRLQALAQGK